MGIADIIIFSLFLLNKENIIIFNNNNYIVRPSEDIMITVRGITKRNIEDMRICFSLYQSGTPVLTIHDFSDYRQLNKGSFEAHVKIPCYNVRPGEYFIGLGGGNERNTEWFFSKDVAQLTILEECDDSCEKICVGILNLSRDRFDYVNFRKSLGSAVTYDVLQEKNAY